VPEPKPPVASAKPLDAAILYALCSVGAVAVVFALGALFIGGPAAGLGVALGGLVATLNLWFFAYVGRGVLAGGTRSRFWTLLAVLKIVLLFGAVWFLMKSGYTSPLALALGYGALPLGITIGAFLKTGYDVEPPPDSNGNDTGVPDENLVPRSPESGSK
jgi:hypothetical protein